MNDLWAGFGSFIASAIFLWAMVKDYIPYNYATKYTKKLIGLVYPYVHITFPEYTGKRMRRSEAYSAIEAYLTASCTQSANKLTAVVGKDTSNLLLSMGDNEEVEDYFNGVQLRWASDQTVSKSQVVSIFYPAPAEKRYYSLTFHQSHRSLVVDSYLAYVMKEGRELGVKNRQRKLFTNNPSTNDGYGGAWSHIVFEHPASFEKLAMDPSKKNDIMEDLDAFRQGKEYYAKIGKAWKRGYLLFGPPGTGKSTMIAAMANYMDYDIYDIELTIVKTNTDLRKLLIETTSKSIIVLEDIDCSLDLTGKRKKKAKTEKQEDGKKPPGEEEDESSKVTLSGLLNFIDGLWSACGGERIIIFTTNHVEKLDPALIRRGRMDKHIEMAHCEFEAFKVLARNYLDVESHPLFETIETMMGEIKITPADVAENLMPKSLKENADTCLGNLIQALEKVKEEQEASVNANHPAEEISEDNSEN